MSENTCYHYYKNHTEGENSTTYCRDCNLIFIEVPTIYGTLSIGEMVKRFDTANQTSLNIQSLISDHLGIDVSITNVILSKKDYEDKAFITFAIGNKAMYANLVGVTFTTGYEATKTYYVAPLEEVAS